MKKNKELDRPLIEALRGLDLATLKSLLDQGADPDAKDESGWSPLHRLAEICKANGAEEAQEKAAVKAAKLLIRRGADVDARIEGLGQSPAYVAASTIEPILQDGRHFPDGLRSVSWRF